MDDIIIKVIDLPVRINALTVANEDGSYTICINARASFKQQYEAYLHELQHIQNYDFQKDDVQAIESKAHLLLWYLLR